MKVRSIGKIFVLIAVAVVTTCTLAACANSSGASSKANSSATVGSASSVTPNTANSSGVSASGDDQQTGSASNASASGQAGSVSSVSGSYPVSLVKFAGIANVEKLVADMSAGKSPTSCTVCYDQMGTRPYVTVTDPDTIADIYGKLVSVTVNGPSNESITDCYHHVSFVLQDGTKVGFNFEGEGLLSLDRENYSVSGGGALWSLVRDIQDEYMEAKGASAG